MEKEIQKIACFLFDEQSVSLVFMTVGGGGLAPTV